MIQYNKYEELKFDINTNYSTCVLMSKKSDFFILDDNVMASNISAFEEYLSQKKINYLNISLMEISNLVGQRLFSEVKLPKFDIVVGLGTGGTVMLNMLENYGVFNNISKCRLRWSHVWDESEVIGYSSDIYKYDWNNKKILIVEDVVATGETIITAAKEFEKMGGKVTGVISAIISGLSPFSEKTFIPLVAGLKAQSNKGLDEDVNPYWFPAIYSIRHLLYGDKEMPNFYEKLSSTYFSGDKDFFLAIDKSRK